MSDTRNIFKGFFWGGVIVFIVLFVFNMILDVVRESRYTSSPMSAVIDGKKINLYGYRDIVKQAEMVRCGTTYCANSAKMGNLSLLNNKDNPIYFIELQEEYATILNNEKDGDEDPVKVIYKLPGNREGKGLVETGPYPPRWGFKLYDENWNFIAEFK